MIRENLDDIPKFTLPSGYSIRWYQLGYEEFWTRIHILSDEYTNVTPTLFREEFGVDVRALSRRQCYLFEEDDNPIGTATAWFGAHRGQSFGRIHWIAILPEMQGKGLAKPLLAAVCNRLRNLGHTRAYLTTQTARISAINLYAKFGFSPVIDSDKEREIWKRLQKHLKYPVNS